MSWWTDLTSGVSGAFTDTGNENTFLGGVGDFFRSDVGSLIRIGLITAPTPFSTGPITSPLMSIAT